MSGIDGRRITTSCCRGDISGRRKARGLRETWRVKNVQITALTRRSHRDVALVRPNHIVLRAARCDRAEDLAPVVDRHRLTRLVRAAKSRQRLGAGGRSPDEGLNARLQQERADDGVVAIDAIRLAAKLIADVRGFLEERTPYDGIGAVAAHPCRSSGGADGVDRV